MLMEEEVIVNVITIRIRDNFAQRKLLVHLKLYAASQENANRKQPPLILEIIVDNLSSFDSNELDPGN